MIINYYRGILCYTLYKLLFLALEYVPCPLVEIRNGRKKIIQQPVDLTNLTAALADAAVNFIDKKSGNKDTFAVNN